MPHKRRKPAKKTAKAKKLEEVVDEHRPIKIWLVMILGSLLFSSVVITSDPVVTGFAIHDYMDETPELTAQVVGVDEYMSNLYSATLLIFLIVVAQVGVYFYVKHYYRKDEVENMPQV